MAGQREDVFFTLKPHYFKKGGQKATVPGRAELPRHLNIVADQQVSPTLKLESEKNPDYWLSTGLVVAESVLP